MNNLYLQVSQGLKTKIQINPKFKKTRQKAERLGIDIENTTQFIKRGNTWYKVSFISGKHSKKLGGRYFEDICLLPFLTKKIKYD